MIKTSAIFSSENKYSQGLLVLNTFLTRKSEQKASFIAWKYHCHRSLYLLWKDIVKKDSNFQEFEVILKVLHKRKAEVDDMWGMIQTQEEKFIDLSKRNKLLESKNREIQGQTPEYCEKSIQVNFLQDSMLRRTHAELEQLEKSLHLKQKQLEDLSAYLKEKSEQLTAREKNFHQKQFSSLNFHEISPKDFLKSSISDYKSQIFQEHIEDNIWLQLIEPSKVTSSQLNQLHEYEKLLFLKHEELDHQKSKISQDVHWINSYKKELDERELKISGIEALKEHIENERNDLQRKYEEVLQATEEMESQIEIAKNRTRKPQKNPELAICEWKLNTQGSLVKAIARDSLDYLQIGLEELSELQKKGILEENLTEVIVENIIRFGEGLMQREKDFAKEYYYKSLYLENSKAEVEDLKRMLKLEETLTAEDKALETQMQVISHMGRGIETLEIFKETVFEKQLYSIDRCIMDIEQEEMEIKKCEYEHESAHYSKLSQELQTKIADYDNKIFEIKSVLKLLTSLRPGNLEIFKQEISRILMKHESNPETSTRLKLIMTVYLWLTRSYNESFGKHQLRMKISFYLLRLRVLMLKQGFAVAPVSFSVPTDHMWLEVFWLRAKHQYFRDVYARPELVALTKDWFIRFITRKLGYAFEIMSFSRYRMQRDAFWRMRNKCIERDKRKTQCLYSQLMRVKEKSIGDIRKDVNIRAACRILPLFERFNKFWVMNMKIHVLKWKNFSATIENLYYQHTISDIYSTLSELMHKEHKFRNECTQTQNLLRCKISDTSKLLDKILF